MVFTAEVKQFGGTYGKTTETKPEDVVVDNGAELIT